MSDIDHGEATEWKKFSEYSLKVDPDQDDKATEIRLCNFGRPHMRAFHCSWWGFFMAFFIWFAIAPLLTEIKTDLGLSKQQIWTSSIVGVGGTIFVRFLMGPLCDKYGSRIPFCILLCCSSIPVACTGFVQTATGLAVLRLFIGFAGGSFVMCQYWTSRMFTKEVVGTANALVGGWGNLGGGVTQLVMGSALFPLFRLFYDGDSEKAWRTVCVVPAFVTFVTGCVIYFISDDSPKGNYGELKKHGSMAEVSAAASFRQGAFNLNTWILFAQYACTFGVELTMDNAAALYFKDAFGQSTESAAAIASIFGWMNIFARALGGYLSDRANAKLGFRGRLCMQVIVLVFSGALVVVFAHTGELAGAIIVMVVFSVFVQAGCGTTYGIVPYIDPPATGSISGIVGAGGNVGAVCFGLGFRQLDYEEAFYIMGFTAMAAAVLTIFLSVKGYSRLLWGQDDVRTTKQQTLAVPEHKKEDVEEDSVSN